MIKPEYLRTTEQLNEDPTHEELFSVERLEHYAEKLAHELEIRPRSRKGRSLRTELKKSGNQLEAAYKSLARAIQEKHSVSPASEWFVDNFHLIESQFREINQNLPDDYYYGLPQLSQGELKGYPRVYAIAMVVITHTDAHLDEEILRRFLVAFQKVSPLEIGELWALAITLRIVLIQDLSVRAQRLVSARQNRANADALADVLVAYAIKPEVTERDIVALISRELNESSKFNRAFLVQLIQRLRDQDPNVWPAFDWLEKKLNELSSSTEKITKFELHRQASAQVSVGNIIGSLRFLTALDWRDFFESVNQVDPVLARDPDGAYLQMDFATRDQYRHAIEAISKRSSLSELEVAERAVALSGHVGEHLIGRGREDFEKSCQYRPKFREQVKKTFLGHPTFLYLTSFFILTVLFLSFALYYFNLHSTSGLAVLCLFALIALLPASELAASFLNHYITYLIKPHFLPRMDMEEGIPSSAQTMVVIPTLFSKEAVVKELVERLEIHSLANPDQHLTFALLGDFTDAPNEVMPQDDVILKAAQVGIAELNSRYCSQTEPRFHLFHRKRLWNEGEGAWIGWERKRGKLLEFNRLLRGASDTSYIVATADQDLCSQIKYVITLDSDTLLPRDAARKLVGTITHPLNLPVIDHKLRRVTRGYGILQPRISVTASSALETRFSKIYSGNVGIDPYTTAVSDVYQDLFKEGSFTGKGLYVVDAFEEAMENRVPENAVLSHDLFEGSYARCALVTDVELFDDYPGDFDTFSKRGHRWIRGDWQIAPWLFPYVKNAEGKWVRNNLSLISRWKIFDNLRRSLVPVTSFIWLLLAWTILPGSTTVWSLLIALMYLFPVYSTVVTGEWMRRGNVTWQGHIYRGWRDTKIKVGQIFLTMAFLAKEAWVHADAIVRVLWRMFVSKKKLLEWTSFAQLSKSRKENISYKDFLDSGPVLAVLAGVLIFFLRAEALIISSPFLILWILNPLIKNWISKKPKKTEVPLTPDELKELRLYARSTWHFFETFVREEDNWLAPDNYQENPKPVVAHRTSPTNIGLQFLAGISAYDLGYTGQVDLVEGFERTFQTLDKLPLMHGHFYNWYDTRSLQPLHPRYISTVDSGNLAGHLMTLKQFLLESTRTSRTLSQLQKGLEDSIIKINDEVKNLEIVAPVTGDVNQKQLQKYILSCLDKLQGENITSIDGWRELLIYLMTKLNDAEDLLEAVVIDSGDSSETLLPCLSWIKVTLKQLNEFERDLTIEESDLVQRQLILAKMCDDFVQKMDFKFLFDQNRKLFVIGFNVEDSRKDNSYYDLLASESRLASFVAIAKGDVSQEHWFRLGRKMAPVKGGRALIAWTATMFEYLMPVLVMKRYKDTLLEQTYRAIVQRQIEYGIERNVPWGVSEAGFNARDLHMNYQYGPFGIPGLGLKRGLSDELVVSPYSTMLAALIAPREALENLQRLKSLGAFSQYGFYESLDFTAERVPGKQKFVILESYMAHHQGMSLVALNNILNDSLMQERFHADPLVQASELLLQERIPPSVELTQPRSEEIQSTGFLHSATDFHPRLYSDVNLSLPRTQLLSNGTYSVMVTSTGSGYSRCGPLAITRWREDATRDHWGQYFYIRNRNTDEYWSPTHQPLGITPRSFGTTFSEDKVEFWRREKGCLTRMEILVSQEDNVEMRRITITNESDKPQELEVTSFMETVMAKSNDDNAHPAFSNLFVQTEYVSSGRALLATRRARSKKENPPWIFHVLAAEGNMVGATQYETDRARFIGRGRSVANPYVIDEKRPLSNSTGSVLDPVFSLRQSFKIAPGETATLTFATGLAEEKEEALTLVDKYRDIHFFQRESEIAWTQAQVQLRHLNISNAKAHIYQRLAGRVLYLDSSLRPGPDVLAQNSRAQTNLWAYGISGDLPIILTQISDEKDMPMIRELLHAHEYLRLKGLIIDLVILNERAPSYLQSLQDELQRQIRMSGSQALLDRPGGVFLRRTDLMPKEDVVLLRTVARVILSAERGTLDEQLKHRKPRSVMPAPFVPTSSTATYASTSPIVPRLEFFNGLGGFTGDSREYVITLKEGEWTPAPWINVIANSSDFGFTVSESGSGYTWSVNSRENRLTPWTNDPISDPPGEVIYLRDEVTGEFWTPTPLPIREAEPYLIRHGQGYTKFEHHSHGIEQNLELFVAMDAGVKINRLRIKNTGSSYRRLSVTSFVEWVLGFARGTSAPYVIPEFDKESGVILARNPYNNEFASRVAFTDISETERSFTCDRREFLGRNGTPSSPAALKRTGLSGTSGAGLDPCAAFQTRFDLAPGEEKTIIVIVGQAENSEKARELALKYRNKEEVEKAFQDVLSFWEKTLTTVEINTPDPAMNTLVNRWLVYQTLSCRIWARSAFYQSGGAYGFRDQLQDVMAMVHSHPEITRAQILTAAARQFKEGDVQHWWHPPTGRGVRTHFSDDLIWLPFVVSYYVKITGDYSVLEEKVPFIEAPLLETGQDDAYTHPRISEESGTILEHCARTLDRSLKVGAHGLPLMGAGDWNDGMSRVGHEGKGESVWVAWFLYSTLKQFIPLCEPFEEDQRVKAYGAHLDHLKRAVEENAWDGDWYRRAYFDDGTPLGSALNEECRIDSISQSWSVLSGAGDKTRATRAMAAVNEYLIRRGDGLIQLFTPAFDKTPLDPGYIKGYLPGVRENGGQYTHAAIWTLMAYAELGDGDQATELYGILNPINHASTRAGMHKYKVEPYVVAADIYGVSPHVGRGGWTWYTGSASWMYRAAVESILGFEVKGTLFRVNPKVPMTWEGYQINYRYKESSYQIILSRHEGNYMANEWIELENDGKEHVVKIKF